MAGTETIHHGENGLGHHQPIAGIQVEIDLLAVDPEHHLEEIAHLQGTIGEQGQDPQCVTVRLQGDSLREETMIGEQDHQADVTKGESLLFSLFVPMLTFAQKKIKISI